MEYDLNIENAIEQVKKNKAKKVLVQLPDGLKPKAKEIADALKEKTDAEIIIWLGSCFGACDVPYYTDKIGVDLIIQWGHSEWKY